MENSPIKYLDNDVLNYLLPEYVAKMRKKKWFEDLINILVKCYKGSYAHYDNFIHIFDSAYPPKKSDQLNYRLMGFDPILSDCEDYLEYKFDKEYNCNRRGSEFEPSMDTDFIPFYKLFTELTDNKFNTEQLSDNRFNPRYPKLRNYYKYLKCVDPYLEKINKDNILRNNLKNCQTYKMRNNLEYSYLG